MHKRWVVAFLMLSAGVLCLLPAVPSMAQNAGTRRCGAGCSPHHEDQMAAHCWDRVREKRESGKGTAD